MMNFRMSNLDKFTMRKRYTTKNLLITGRDKYKMVEVKVYNGHEFCDFVVMGDTWCQANKKARKMALKKMRQSK